MLILYRRSGPLSVSDYYKNWVAFTLSKASNGLVSVSVILAQASVTTLWILVTESVPLKSNKSDKRKKKPHTP